LVGEGYRLISEADFSPEIAMNCIRLISQGHRTLAIGQGTELLSTSLGKILNLEEILKVFEQKTATAFKVSLILGALAGGADNKAIEHLEKFSLQIGIAYQIMDDIADYQSNNGDIEKRKFSIMLSLIYGKLDNSEKNKLVENLKFNDFKKIYTLIEDYKIKHEAIDLLNDYIQKARFSIDDLQHPGLKIALHEILGKMFRDYI